MEVMDDLLMSEPRPSTQSSGYSGVGSGRSASSAGHHPPHPSHQQRVSIGSSYYGGSRYGDGNTSSTIASSARHSTSYSTQYDPVRVGAGVVVTSHRQSQRRFYSTHIEMRWYWAILNCLINLGVARHQRRRPLLSQRPVPAIRAIILYRRPLNSVPEVVI